MFDLCFSSLIFLIPNFGLAAYFSSLLFSIPFPPPSLFLSLLNIPGLYEGIRVPNTKNTPFTYLTLRFRGIGRLLVGEDA